MRREGRAQVAVDCGRVAAMAREGKRVRPGLGGRRDGGRMAEAQRGWVDAFGWRCLDGSTKRWVGRMH